MPTYEIKAPNGQVYHIDGPDGASDGEIRAQVARQFPESVKTLVRYPATVREKPQEPPAQSAGQYLASAGQNTLAGLAQGAVGVYDMPMAIADGVNKFVRSGISAAGGALADLVSPEAGQKWRDTGTQIDQAVSAVPSASDTIEQVSPTPEGMGGQRLAAQVVGGMMVPFGPKAAPRIAAPKAIPAAVPNAAQEIVLAGDQAGVRVLTSDVKPPTTFIGKNVRAIGERIPYAGTGPVRAAQQGERVEAVKNLAKDFGVEGSTDYLDEVAEDLSKTRGGQVKKLSGIKDAIIDGVQGTVPTPGAIAMIDQRIAKLAAINNDAVKPVINELENFKRTLGSGLSLRNVEENRKILGSAFEGDSMAKIKDIGDKAVRAVYAPLREDMGNFIKATAGPEAFSKWDSANKQLSGMAGELGVSSFKRLLNDAESTPENVAKALFSQKPSEVRRLMGNLSLAGRTKAQSAIIARALEKAGEDVSPDKFNGEITRLGNSVGVVFSGLELARVNGLSRLLSATKQAAVASVAPPTGAQNMPIVGGFAAGTMFGAAALPALGGIGGLARLYESATVRNLLIGLGKAPKGSKAEGQLLERILKVATSQAGVHPNAANDALSAAPQQAVAEQENN